MYEIKKTNSIKERKEGKFAISNLVVIEPKNGMTDAKRAIYDWLKVNAGSSTSDIASGLGYSESQVMNLMDASWGLFQHANVSTDGKALWAARSNPDEQGNYPRRKTAIEPPAIMKFLQYDHLPERLQQWSKPFCEVAQWMQASVPNNVERSVALRKLLEAKDACVRAAL